MDVSTGVTTIVSNVVNQHFGTPGKSISGSSLQANFERWLYQLPAGWNPFIFVLPDTHSFQQLYRQNGQSESSREWEMKTAWKKAPFTKKQNWCLPFPKCVLMLMYRAVPVKLLCSRYGICLWVSGSMYSLAKPKSMMWMMCCFLVDCLPMRKFSGFTSLYIKCLEWTYSMRDIWKSHTRKQEPHEADNTYCHIH